MDRDPKPPTMSRRSFLALGGAVVAVGAGAAVWESVNSARPHLPSIVSKPPAGAIVPDVAADGRTDDRAAIQKALDSAPGDRPSTVWLPGLCAIGQGGVSAGAPFGLVVRKNGVTLTGATGAGLVSTVPGIRLLLVVGARGAPGDPLDDADWITSAPVMPFAGDVAQGQTRISLASAAQAAQLRPGDVVFLRTGQLINSRLPREPDAELNEVLSVSGTTVTLRYPTAKPYRPERTVSGRSGPTDPEGSGAPAPWGVVRATDMVLRDFTVRGLHLLARSPQSTTAAVHLFQVWGAVVDDCLVEFGKYGVAARYARQVTISGTTLNTVGDMGPRDPAWVAPSTGCTDWLVQHCRGGGTVPAKLHGHEGVARLRYVDWRSRTPDGPGQAGASNISVRARAYDHSYDVVMSGAYTRRSCAMVEVTSAVTGPPTQVQFQRLSLSGSPGLAFLDIQSTAVTIYRRGLDLPRGATVRLEDGAHPFV
jgi:hypothetical protein